MVVRLESFACVEDDHDVLKVLVDLFGGGRSHAQYLVFRYCEGVSKQSIRMVVAILDVA